MSKRSTIDFGIDLGTTNSAIAVFNGRAPEIIKDNDDLDITSSAVHISKHGQLRVGKRARQQLLNENADDDVYIEFKRRMGTDHIYKFRSANQNKTPEELSAEVLKSVCGNVQQRLGETVEASVITVPAAFEQRQCAATKRAAEMSGLRECPLLQEPTAAAWAYGLQSETKNEYWLAYDFGGGTFDAAIMKAEDGAIDCIHHGGDNYLGGTNIDWAILEKNILLRVAKDFNFPDLHRKNDRWRATIARLKHAVEVAKIELSRSEKTFLADCVIKDADGEPVEIDFPLTRNEVIAVAEPIIMESVAICLRVLKEKEMSPAMIGKVILVGGPTLAPYFRNILSNELKIVLDHSIDPLTVVARGAAVFASTQLIRNRGEAVDAGTYKVELSYSPVGVDEDFRVRGKVLEEGQDFTGYTIAFANRATDWNSGTVPLKSDGTFKADLLAEGEGRNLFAIQLADAKGTLQKTVPADLPYSKGIPPGDQPVINSLGVEIGDNEYDRLIEKGMPLPAKQTRVYRTTKLLAKGASGETLSIPIVEGENPKADRNRLQANLTVNGSQIRRDLPAGSEVEVTLMMDADRSIRARAFITLLDEEFEVIIQQENRTPDAARLSKDLEKLKSRASALAEKSGSSSDLQEQSARIEKLVGLIDSAQGDPDAANEADVRVRQIKAALDVVEAKADWPKLVERARKELEDLDNIISTAEQLGHGDPKFNKTAKELRTQVEELIAEHRDDVLSNKVEQVVRAYIAVLTSLPEFWVAKFQSAKDQRSKMSDQSTAARLINQGDASIQRGDVQQLRQIVAQLMDLLPINERDKIEKEAGYATGQTVRH